MRTFRILFLDSPANVALLKETCKEEGYVVVGATTLVEAWAFLHGKDHADVIVSAPYLENASVFQFLTGVRASESHQAVMFLILSLEATARGTLLDRSTARAATLLGANAYVVMPAFDPAELISQIKRLQPEIPMLQQSAKCEAKRKAE